MWCGKWRRDLVKQKMILFGEAFILIMLIATINSVAGNSVRKEMYIYDNYAWLRIEGKTPIELDSIELLTYPHTDYTAHELGATYYIETKSGVIKTKKLDLGDFVTTDNQIIPKNNINNIEIKKNRKYTIEFENNPDYIIVKQEGLSWNISHKLELKTNEIASYATIINQTDMNFKGFGVSLMSGIHEQKPTPYLRSTGIVKENASVENIGEKKKIYLGNMDIGAKETKTKVIFNQKIQPTKQYVDDGTLKLEITFKSQNEMPAGDVDVFENGIYIGSYHIKDTAKNEDVKMDLEGVYDISSIEKIIDRNVEKCKVTELHEITIKNYKNEPIHVKVRRNTNSMWKIIHSNMEFSKKDKYTEWDVYVKDTNKLTFTKEYIPVNC